MRKDPSGLVFTLLGKNRLVEVGRDLWRSRGPNPAQVESPRAQTSAQVALEYFQGRRPHNLPGQPAELLSHPHSKEVFPYARTKSTKSTILKGKDRFAYPSSDRTLHIPGQPLNIFHFHLHTL